MHGDAGQLTGPAPRVLVAHQVKYAQLLNAAAEPVRNRDACRVIAFSRLAHFLVPKIAGELQEILELTVKQRAAGPNRYLRNRLAYRDIQMSTGAWSDNEVQFHEDSLFETASEPEICRLAFTDARVGPMQTGPIQSRWEMFEYDSRRKSEPAIVAAELSANFTPTSLRSTGETYHTLV